MGLLIYGRCDIVYFVTYRMEGSQTATHILDIVYTWSLPSLLVIRRMLGETIHGTKDLFSEKGYKDWVVFVSFITFSVEKLVICVSSIYNDPF